LVYAAGTTIWASLSSYAKSSSRIYEKAFGVKTQFLVNGT